MTRKPAKPRVTAQERRIQERLAERELKAKANHLRQFSENCVRNFNIAWICTQLSGANDVPSWYKSILTRMLVGWIVSPKSKRLRLALAWHHINDQFDRQAHREWNAQKKKRKKSKRIVVEPYYVNAWVQFGAGRQKYRHLYLALGGMNSKIHMSLSEIRRMSSESAAGAKRCLQLIDILTFLQRMGVTATNTEGNAILHDIRKLFKRTNQNMFSNDEYDLEPIDSKNLENFWPAAHPSAEFWASLYTISLPAPKVANPTVEKTPVKSTTNALNQIVNKGIYSLPYGNADFQQKLIARAKYFSDALRSRKGIKLGDRFPEELVPAPANLDIFSTSVLESHLLPQPSTKRQTSSR